ncbi:MAG: DUF1127 domain-containing protein [Kiloniellales bacterium]|nr:DUF1127 domain-containing protein [Kiloniellales bacterium]
MHTISIKSLPDRSRAFPGPSRADFKRRITTWISKVRFLPLVWQRRYLERQALANFDDHRLKDIGLTRKDLAREIAKPFWRA